NLPTDAGFAKSTLTTANGILIPSQPNPYVYVYTPGWATNPQNPQPISADDNSDGADQRADGAVLAAFLAALASTLRCALRREEAVLASLRREPPLRPIALRKASTVELAVGVMASAFSLDRLPFSFL